MNAFLEFSFSRNIVHAESVLVCETLHVSVWLAILHLWLAIDEGAVNAALDMVETKLKPVL